MKGIQHMHLTKRWILCLACSLTATTAWAEPDKVEEALSEVRDVNAGLFSRQSSILGTLPGPVEMAAHQMRCRPTVVPKAGGSREITFDAETIRRAAELDPVALRKSKGRMGMRVLPLGITGAYVTEILGHREMVVVHVLDDSPAAGVLQVDDLLLGANGRLFQDPEDPRPEMGNALVESQTPELEGILTLHVARQRKPINVRLDLGNTLAYRETWPFQCEKSKQIKQDAVEFVMSHYPWHRYNFWTPLFLMASGDEAAMEMARRHLCAGLQDEYEESTGASAWTEGYRLTGLSEYYLLTGDSSVLPAIRHAAEGVAWAQYRSGSWSHGAGKGPNVPSAGTAGGGYGEVNCAGLGAFVGLCLARQCDVEPYDHTLPRSIRFFGKFCGANLPYGLGNPSGRSGRMDNGMNSMSAVAFHLLGEEAMADRWARTACYMWMGRERGHAEGIFSAAWGPVGASLAPKEEFHAFMNNMRWAYEMGRTRDGGITFMRGSRWTYPNMTAAMGMFLCLPERRLQILGGQSVFAQAPPDGMEEAAQLYKDKKWSQLRAQLNDFIRKAQRGNGSAEQLSYAKRLLAAHNRLEKHAAATLPIIDRSIQDGMLATASTQLDLLGKMLGEEREEAARLRNKLKETLGDRKPQNPKPEKPLPLVNEKELIKQLELATGGVGDGFAHSPTYIQETNTRGFDGMTSRQIAGFLGHFAGGPAGGAVAALASRKEEALPLVKQLLGDSHHGIRAGAIATLTQIYKSQSEDYRTDVPDELAEIIRLVRPLIKDDSLLVRNEVGRFVQAIRVLNDDIYEMLDIMARNGANIQSFVRYGIKDPVARTRLCMALVDAANRARSPVPGDYKPMVIATTAHLDLCEPYLQTAVDTLNNPEVLNMYGFFSNHPPHGALELFSHYSDRPLVRAHLTDMLRFAVRKRGSLDSYWYAIVEFPHRIVIKIGPEALPVLDAFCKSEGALYRQIQAGQVERPSWWKGDTPEFFAAWRREMMVTAALVRCLHGKTTEQAIDSMTAIYLSDRPWGAWERQRIRDQLTQLGPESLATLRRALADHAPILTAHFDRQIASKQAEATAETDKQKVKPILKEIEAFEGHKDQLTQRIAELRELTTLVESLGAERPSPEDVRTLCRFYVKRPWGNRYPFISDNCSYMRPLDEQQLVLVRDTLQRWSEAARPTMHAFVKEHEETLKKALAELDAEEEFWKPQWSRKSMLPLARIAQEREDIRRISGELGDLTVLIDAAAAEQPTDQQIGTLCRIYTRRGWPSQNARIRVLLESAGAKAVPVIREHVRLEKAGLPAIVANVERIMSDTAKVRVQWHYDRAFSLQRSIQHGLEELAEIARGAEGL